MKKIIKQVSACIVCLGVMSPVFATNGYFAHGYGTKNKALAGAGVALPQDAMIAATNPAGMVWVGADLGVDGHEVVYLAFVLTILMGTLMVSNVRYYSFKEIDFKNRVPFVALLLVVVAYVFASLDPPKVLFAGFLIYAFSGPVLTLVRVRKRRSERHRET